MPSWLAGNLHYVIAAIVTAALLAILRQRGVAKRRAALREGRPTTFEAFLRGSAAPYPRRWRYGWVHVTLEGPAWKPRFSLRRGVIRLPQRARIVLIRSPAGLVESLLTSPGWRIVVAHADEVQLELAIAAADTPTALEALTAGTGASWSLGETRQVVDV